MGTSELPLHSHCQAAEAGAGYGNVEPLGHFPERTTEGRIVNWGPPAPGFLSEQEPSLVEQ